MHLLISKRILFAIVACLAAAMAAIVFHPRPHQMSEKECGPIYQYYANTEGIEVQYIEELRINDSITTNLTLLKATDSTTWHRLLEDFNLQDLFPPTCHNEKSEAIIPHISHPATDRHPASNDGTLIIDPQALEIFVCDVPSNRRRALLEYFTNKIIEQ